MSSRRIFLPLIAVLTTVVLTMVVLPLMRARAVWDSIERVPLERPIPSPSTAPADSDMAPLPEMMLLVGSDSRAGLDNLTNFGQFEGARADVIVLAALKDSQITLLSIPRDLYVADSCDGGRHKLGEALLGCKSGDGLQRLVSEVEDTLKVSIDHAVSIDMNGFQDVVDRLGGYEICVDHATRDDKSGLDLASGCTRADGATTLAWLRSRNTLEEANGRWRQVPGVSDIERNARQRQFMLDVLERLSDLTAPTQLLDLAQDIAPHLTVDNHLELNQLVRWGWSFRSADLVEADIPVVFDTGADGASVLIPDTDLETLARDLFGN